jgi:hypothetical protein
MGSITLTREKARWRDRARAYKLKIDGVEAGAVRSGETLAVPLAPGMHRVQLALDWCTSPELQLDGDRDHALRCKAGGHSFMAGVDIVFRSDRYIALETA